MQTTHGSFNSTELELDVLSYVFNEAELAHELSPDDFVLHDHQVAFKLLKAGNLVNQDMMIALATRDVLFTRKTKSIQDLKNLRMRRDAIKEANDKLKDLMDSTKSNTDLGVANDNFDDIISTPYSTLDEDVEYFNNLEYTPLFIEDLNRYMPYFQPGQTTYIAASSGVGKTGFGLQLMEHFGEKYAFISLEMTSKQTRQRRLANRFYRSQIGSQGFISLNDEDQFRECMQDFNRGKTSAEYLKLGEDENCIFVHKPSLSVDDIWEILKKLKYKYKIKNVLIDSFHKLPQTKFSENISDAYNANTIEAMAKDLNLRIAILSQTVKKHAPRGRSGEAPDEEKFQQKYMRVYKADIRGGKSIEDSAYYILGLWIDKEQDGGYIQVLKNRDGVESKAIKIDRFGPIWLNSGEKYGRNI